MCLMADIWTSSARSLRIRRSRLRAPRPETQKAIGTRYADAHPLRREADMSTVKHSVIRLPGVIAKTGLSRSSIYAAIGKNEFPASITLGARAVGWLEADIDAWLESRIRCSRKV